MIPSNININKSIDYFLVYFLIATTGMSFFYKHKEFIFIGCFISILIAIQKTIKIDRFIIQLLLFMFIIQIGQAIKLNYFSLYTFAGLYPRLIFAYLVIKILNKKFVDYYINIIYIFSLVSLICFVVFITFPPLMIFTVYKVAPFFKAPFNYTNQLYSLSPNILIYNLGGILYYTFPRNSGPFWEPGAFAGFIILAIAFNTIYSKTFLNKKNIVLIISIITTFSTSGYIALGVWIISYQILFLRRRKKNIYIISSALIFIIIILKTTFIADKINHDYYITKETNRITRFRSALLDVKDFCSNPIFGVGRNDRTRYQNYDSVEMRHRNNGIAILLVTYGIFFFLFYFFSYHKSFLRICYDHNVNGKISLVLLFIILIIGFSEPYFTRPFFYSLLFLQIVYSRSQILNLPARIKK